MAKILFSAVVGDARKKIGGVVFTKSRFGAIVRRKVSPVQPRTNFQRSVRANFTATSKAWSGSLNDTQRQGWINLAAANPVKDRFGNSQVLTGLQMFERVNRNLHTSGFPPLTDAPLSLSVTDLGGLTITETTATSALTLTKVANSSAGSLVLSGVTAAVAGLAAYAGTITGGTSNAFAGLTFSISGFAKNENNGDFICTASTALALTLQNPRATDETLAAAAISLDADYTGTITGGDSDAFVGQLFTVAGFADAGNNGTMRCTRSTALILTLYNPNEVDITAAGTATGLKSLIASTPNAPADTEYLVLTASAYKNPGRVFVGKAYRTIGVDPGDTTQPLDVQAPILAKFGSFQTGQRINVGLYNIDVTTGAAGKPYTASLLAS